MIHPPEDKKRKVSEPSEGTPDNPASSSRPPSDPPASATFDRLGIDTSAGPRRLTNEEKRNWVEGTAEYFISIGWHVQWEGRNIVISQPEKLIGHQNVSGSEN